MTLALDSMGATQQFTRGPLQSGGLNDQTMDDVCAGAAVQCKTGSTQEPTTMPTAHAAETKCNRQAWQDRPPFIQTGCKNQTLLWP